MTDIFPFVRIALYALAGYLAGQITPELLDEVQRVTVAVETRPEIQRLGVYLVDVDTSACAVHAACPEAEAQLTGTFRLRLDPAQCGGGGDSFCQLGLQATYGTASTCAQANSCLSLPVDPRLAAYASCSAPSPVDGCLEAETAAPTGDSSSST